MAYYNHAETIKQKKPSDLNQLARLIVDDVRDECAPDEFSEEEPTKQPTHQKNPAAVALRRLDGKKGGPARAEGLSPRAAERDC